MKPVIRKIKPKPIGETRDENASLSRVVPLNPADKDSEDKSDDLQPELEKIDDALQDLVEETIDVDESEPQKRAVGAS